MFTGALMKFCAVELCSCDGVRCKISAGDIESLTWSVGEKRAVFMFNVSLNDNSYASSISLILGPVMEGGVITSDAVRHPLEPLHPETRMGLLELARSRDVIALRWGR